jgi:hypothetical protein
LPLRPLDQLYLFAGCDVITLISEQVDDPAACTSFRFVHQQFEFLLTLLPVFALPGQQWQLENSYLPGSAKIVSELCVDVQPPGGKLFAELRKGPGGRVKSHGPRCASADTWGVARKN